MGNILRNIETDEVIIFNNNTYSTEILEKCRDIHRELVRLGKLEGDFMSDKWMGYSDVKKYGIDFMIAPTAYKNHIGKEFGITLDTMKCMLKCYAIYCTGSFIYQTIAKNRINVIKNFLECFPSKKFKQSTCEITAIEDFLVFIGTPDKQIENIITRIPIIKEKSALQRNLSPIINYLVIENEINNLYRTNLGEETFRKWFPIYFWVNITFILPLRATEMLVTPLNCIQRTDDGKVYLKVRRTRLKKRKQTVSYDVNIDYKEFTYEIPDNEVACMIEKYISVTSDQQRRFLFEYSDLMINNMLSLQAFNHLLGEFMEERIIGNPYYDFARYASGIQEFEKVTAGDSRPIAMANLYFQKAGEDICRQLADHVHINTSSGYYTNISETIWASSIIRFQKKKEYESRYSENMYKRGNLMVLKSISQCLSEKYSIDNENLEDCIKEGHLEDCIGCKYYLPAISELEEFMTIQKERADKGAKKVIEFMNKTTQAKNLEVSIEELFLKVQTDASRYRMGCEITVKEKYDKWQEHKNTQKTFF
ncbi:MAG: hypothetical protein J6B87_02100 [Clostridia bacterium]|nr:hypothetical protein [Clostridia bacterium]